MEGNKPKHKDSIGEETLKDVGQTQEGRQQQQPSGDDEEETVEPWLLPLAHDPWEATLLPAEPLPQFYEEYEQYEAAMRRWALACCKQRLLPHASQLLAMKSLKIQPAKEVFSLTGGLSTVAGADTAAETAELGRPRPGYVNPYAPMPGEWAPARVQIAADPPLVPVATLREKLRTMDDTSKTRAKLNKIIDTIEREREQCHRETGQFNVPVEIEEATTAALPPLDTKISWARVPANIAQHPTTALADSYASELRLEIENYEYGNRLAEIHDRAEMALMLPQLNEAQAKLEAKAVHTLQYQKPFTFDAVLSVVFTPLLLDRFTKLLERPIPSDFTGATYLTTVSSAVTMQTFPQLLQQWDYSLDIVVRAKLAWLVGRLMRANGPQYVHSLTGMTILDCHCLYIACRCLHYLDSVPADIFPLLPHNFSLVEIALQKAASVSGPAPRKCSEVVLSVFSVYYLRLIQQKLHDDKLRLMVSNAESVLADQLQKTPAFVSAVLECIGHRSVTVSNMMLVAMLQLIKIPNQTIQSHLRSAEVKLCEKVKNLCRSRFSHTQLACRQITHLLFQDLSWRSYIFTYFMNNPSLIDELAEPGAASQIQVGGKKPTPQQQHQHAPVTPTLVWFISIGFLEALDGIVDMATADNVWWTLGDETFSRLLTAINKAARFRVDYGAEALSKVFERLCIKSTELKLVQARDELKPGAPGTRRGGGMATKELSVGPTETPTIFSIIQQLSSSSDARALNMRAHLLSAVRILLRHRPVFEQIKLDTTFYQKLLSFCKDGRHFEFCKNAWKLFYELIEYHAGVLDFLDRSKLLSQFADILGTTVYGNTVMLHSLHYIGKLFSLFAAEQARAQRGLPLRRDDNRSVERDVKTFLIFFKDHHLFIKLHMIYKRFAQAYPGAAFLELAKLYRTLCTLPECQRLLREIQKNEDYKSGIQRLVEMYDAGGH